MKAKITILLMLIITSLQAQTANDIYLIGVTSEGDNGLRRNELNMGELDMTPTICITILSRNKEYRVEFMHTNYNVTKLAKLRPVHLEDQQQMIEKPISFLETINPIDLNEINYEWQTAEEAWEFGESLDKYKMREQGKKIYFIDRADITNTTVKLIEIKYIGNNRPRQGWIITQ